MNQQKPEFFRPALIAGAVAGLLSGLPIVGAGNCLCCLWIVGGAAVAVKLLMAGPAAGPLKAGDGAVVGALTGIVAAVVDTLIKIPLQPYNLELARRILDTLDLESGMPAGLEGLFSGATARLSPGWLLVGLFVSAAVYAVMGALGGVIGVSLFGRKPVSPGPPSAPSAPPQGPADAS
jgi:hypothetical protein